MFSDLCHRWPAVTEEVSQILGCDTSSVTSINLQCKFLTSGQLFPGLTLNHFLCESLQYEIRSETAVLVVTHWPTTEPHQSECTGPYLFLTKKIYFVDVLRSVARLLEIIRSVTWKGFFGGLPGIHRNAFIDFSL